MYGTNKEEGSIAVEMMKWKEVAPRFILQFMLLDPNKISFAVSTIFYNCGKTAVTYRGG
jgi:hypothetical protein